MRTNVLQRAPKIETKVRVPRGHDVVGTTKEGWMIVEGELPLPVIPPELRDGYEDADPEMPHEHRGLKEFIRDEDGKRVHREDPATGHQQGLRTRVKTEKQRIRYALVPHNGKVTRQFRFEETEEEKARRLRAEKIRQVQEGLAERIVERGLDLDAVLDRLAPQDVSPEQKDPDPPDPPTDVRWPLVMSSPGRWNLPPDGSETVQGNKDDARREIRKLGYEPVEPEDLAADEEY